MYNKVISDARSWFSDILKNRNTYFLIAIAGLAIFLRVWNLHHIFNIVHNYDEGAYALGARFITQGYLPYRDFILVHPPLHELLLAGIFKIFGYNYFYAVYFSVAVSIASVILVYFVAKKLGSPASGIIAALLFAVSPDMVYWGRRVVQESLGIFLILAAIYFAIVYIEKRKVAPAIVCGILLGLTVATKYTFIPFSAAVILAVVFTTTGKKHWAGLKMFGNPNFLGYYLCIAAGIWIILLLVRALTGLEIPLPFLDTTYINLQDIAIIILIFIIPLIISFRLCKMQVHFRNVFSSILELLKDYKIWLFPAGTIAGFFAVTGYFWTIAPSGYINQTLVMQLGRGGTEFPSFVGLVRITFMESSFLKISGVILLLGVFVLILLLNRKHFLRTDAFIFTGMTVSFVLCQAFYQLPRYYVSVLIYVVLGISQLLSLGRLTDFKAGSFLRLSPARIKVTGLLLVFALFTSSTLVLLNNYTGWDVLGGNRFASNEEQVYKEAVNYFEENKAAKVFSINPIFPALSKDIPSTLDFDTFALLWLEEIPPSEIVENAKNDGVDYVIIDPWLSWWGNPWGIQARQLMASVVRNGDLVKELGTDSKCHVLIYRLK